MATANLELKVTASGMTPLVQQSADFNNNMQAGVKAASNIGGTASSRAIAAKAAPASSGGGGGPGDTTAYNVQRSVSGSGTGSATSDFARQAQGLGGLVHLYATFAANIFAAESAFRALDNAVNTAHLAQGLDQLGAQSGKSLGTLAKQLNSATDGALSFKEAMSSTANASAAGLTNDQILKMGEVAKKASQALGWDMADAMDRLTKGIAKNRPQLLDELGILVNSNTIYTNYARSIGTTTSALTDYQKKQAFANAVLQQGLDKFSAIDIPTNPYVQLEASMSNIAQTGLMLVNTVLTPLVKILAQSPTELATVMGGIGLMLVNKALPALGAWREGLTAAAKTAAEKSKAINESFFEYKLDKAMTRSVIDAAPFKAAAADALKAAQESISSVLGDKAKLVTNVRNITGSDGLPEVQAAADVMLKRNQTILATMQANGKATQADIDLQQKRVDGLNNASKALTNYNINLQKSSAIESNIFDDLEKNQPKRGSEEWQRAAIARRQGSAAASKDILAQVGQNTQVMGMRDSFTQLGKLVDDNKDKLTGFGKVTTYVSGTFGILGSTINTALSAFAPYIQLFGLLVVAFEALDGWMSKAAEQQKAFETATESSTASVKTAADSVEYLRDKSKNMFSLQGIDAMTNAIGAVSDSMNNQIKAFDTLQEKQSGWERGWDSFWHILGKGNVDILINSYSKDIPAALNTMVFSSNAAAAKSKIADILKIDPKNLNIDSIKSSLKSLSDIDAAATIEKLNDAMKSITEQERMSTASLDSFKSSLDGLDKEVDTITNKLAFKDGAGKVGDMLIDSSIKLSAALQDPIKGLEAIQSIAGDMKTISLLPPGAAKQLIDTKLQADALAKSLQDATKKQLDAQAAINKAKASNSLVYKGAIGDLNAPKTPTLTDSGKVLTEALNAADTQVATIQAKITSFTQAQTNVVVAMYDAGAKQIELGLKEAVAQAEQVRLKSDLSINAAAGLDTVKENLAIRLKELDLQKQVIDNSYNLQKAILDNTSQLDILTTEQKLTRAKEDLKTAKPEDKKSLEDSITNLNKHFDLLVTAQYRRTGTLATGATMSNVITNDRQGSAQTKYDNAVIGTTNQQYAKLAAQKDAAEANVNANIYDAINKAILDTITRQTKERNDQITLEQTQLTNAQARVTLEDRLAGTYSEILATRKDNQQYAANELAYRKEMAPLLEEDAKLNAARDKKSNASALEQSKISAAQAYNDTLKQEAVSKKNTANEAVRLDAISTKYAATQATILANSTAEAAIKASETKGKLEDLAYQEQLLSNAVALGVIDAQTAADKKASIDLDKQALVYKAAALDASEKEALAQANLAEAERKQSALKIKMAQDDVTLNAKNVNPYGDHAGTATIVTAVPTEAVDAAQKAVDVAKAHTAEIEKSNTAAQNAINLTKQQTQALDDQKQHLADISSISKDLAIVFDGVGKALGDMVSAIDRFSTNTEKSLATVANAQDAYTKAQQASKDASDPRDVLIAKDKEAKALKTLTKEQSKATEQQLGDTADIIGSTKELFDKKSKAYQTLAAIEKGIHLASLAMKIADMAADTTHTGVAVANSGARGAASIVEAGIDGVKAVVKAIASLPFPLNIAAGAATAAVIGGLLESIGATGPEVGSAGPSTADIQKSQGTGQTYDASGALVSRAGGVVGDPTAKAKAITDSIDALNKTFFNTMGVRSSLLLTSLKGIQTNTASTVAALLTSNNGSGIGISTSVPAESSWKAGESLASIPVIGSALSGIVGALFGGGKTYSGVDSQILNFGGSASSLAAGKGSGNVATTISTQHDVPWYEGNSYKTVNTTINALGSDVMDKVANIFKNFNKTMLVIGHSLGVSASGLAAELSKNLDFSLNVTNMTGQQMVDALGSELSVKMNAIVEAQLPWVKQYVKSGEEMAATAIRLIRDGEVITTALDMTGQSVQGLATTTDTIEYATAKQQDLIDKFGGSLDAFGSAMQTYYDAFYTDSEKATNSFKNVQTSLANMGIAGITTNAQLKTLINAQDLNTEAGRAVYAQLVQLAPAFNDATVAMQKMQDATDSLTTQALDLIASTTSDQTASDAATAKSTAISRAATLKATDPTLKSMQLYVFALQDVKNAQTKLNTIIKNNLSVLKTQESTLTSTTSSLDNFITSLDNFNTSLTQGADSILTPSEKYMAATANFSSVLAATNSSDQKTRDAALNQIQSAASDFLSASKTYNASSEQYSIDFNLVQSAITSTSSSLKVQKSVAQQTLDELTAQTDVLQLQVDGIDGTITAVQDTTSAVTALQDAQAKAADAARAAVIDASVVDSNYQQTIIDALNLANGYTESQIAYEAKVAAEAKAAADKQAKQDAITAAIASNDSQAISLAIFDASSSTGDRTQQQDSSWSAMSQADKAAYYSANPIEGKIASALLTATLALMPGGTIVSMLNNSEIALTKAAFEGTDAYNAEMAKQTQAAADTAMAAAAAAQAASDAAAAATAVGAGGHSSGYATSGNFGLSSWGGADTSGASGSDSSAAIGGYRSGKVLVGEVGPEIVDMQTPGRVYTASQTQGMFNLPASNNAAVIEELRSLRREVSMLRAQQQEETGHLINATYDSQNQNADAIATAVTETTANSTWAAKVAATSLIK